MNTAAEPAILRKAVHVLREQGLAATVQKQPKTKATHRADAWLRVGRGKTRVDYVVEIKPKVTPATVGAVVTQLRHAAKVTGLQPLLITDYLTPPMAAKLRTQEQQFADTAGNAFLEGPGFFVYVTGRKLEGKNNRLRPNRTFTTVGLKVLFALICDPELAHAPQRAIAAAAGVALGALPAVLADLQQTGFLLVLNNRRRLNATKHTLDEWALAYAQILRVKTLQARYVAQRFDDWPKWKLDPKQAQWGGEPAANLLVGYLRPGVLTIYADKLPPRLMVEQRMTPAHPLADERLVEVRKPFWGEGLPIDVATRTGTVPPALVYADLLATGDGRCIETAQIVYDEHLARLFQAA